MKYIGKADKFYTLWEVNVETRTTLRGNTYKVFTHEYLKNVSFDKSKAIEKYPNAIVDESLRGHHSWVSYEYDKLPADEFCGGKYKGEKIADCIDYSYIHWALENTSIIPYESKDIAVGILEKNGYRKINDYKIATPVEVEEIEKRYNVVEEIQKEIEKTGKITITPIKNLDDCGCLFIDSTIEIIFPRFKEIEYNGYSYSLPLDSKGKAKRIKNNKIEITPEKYDIIQYDLGVMIEVVVKDFNIVK